MLDVPQMTLTERRNYLARMHPRYLLADRTERSRLLDEMIAVTSLHRKSLVRLLNAGSWPAVPTRRSGAAPTARSWTIPSA